MLTTISDRKLTTAPGHFTAEITNTQDYYPFGSLMPGRKYSSNSYRFGFGGHEKDDEVFGVTGSYLSFGDYGYDPRIVRRWNIDLMAHEMPGISPYVAFFNNPIVIQDPSGEFGIAGFFIGFAVDVGVQMLANSLAGKPITDIDYGDAFFSGLVGIATGGLGNVGKFAGAAKDVSEEQVKKKLD